VHIAITKKHNKSIDTIHLVCNICIVVLLGILIASFHWPVLDTSLYSSAPSYNFGGLKRGNSISHEFTIINIHPWKVEITDARTSCGCTHAFGAHTLPFFLKPFETTKFTVTINTANKPIGPIEESAIVSMNNNPESILLTMKGRLQ